MGRITRPASLHPYAYASADPINRRDPTGRNDDLPSLEVAQGISENLDTLAEAASSVARSGVTRTASSGVESLAEYSIVEADAVTETATEEGAAVVEDMTTEATELQRFVGSNAQTYESLLTNLGRAFNGTSTNTVSLVRLLSVARGAKTYGFVLCGILEFGHIAGGQIAAGFARFSQDPDFADFLGQAIFAELGTAQYTCVGQ